MKKALLVVNAQEDFIGEQRSKKKFNYYDVDELVLNINNKIEEYKADNKCVAYIAHVLPSNFFNKKFIGYGIVGTSGAKICENIKIVCDHYFEKSEIELVGIDVAGSISETAKGALDLDLKVSIPNNCIGKMNEVKYYKVCTRLKNFGVVYL